MFRRSGSLPLHIHILINVGWSIEGPLRHFSEEQSRRIYSLSLDGSQAVTIDIVWDYTAPDAEWLAHWSDILAQSPYIQRLVLKRRAYSQIIPILLSNAFRSSEKTEDSETPPLLPGLQVLVLKHGFCRAELGDSYQPLIEWLTLRKAQGAPIKELQIDQRLRESSSSALVSSWSKLQELVNVVTT